MYQHKLHVWFRQSADDGSPLIKIARCVACQHIPFELRHKDWNPGGHGKREITLTHIHLPILTCPLVDLTKPALVNLADIGRREPMPLVILADEPNHRPFQRTGFGIVHLLWRLDAEPVLEHLLVRAGLILGLA